MKLKSPLLGSLAALALWFSAVSCALAADTNTARPFLHPLFGDHLVLQRDAKVPVWGWASPGTKVTVRFAGQSKTAVAKADGKWMLRLSPMPASSEPRSLTVTSSEGGQPALFRPIRSPPLSSGWR